MIDAEARLNHLLSEVFQLSSERLNGNLSQDVVEAWDSLNHLRLVITLEEEFGVSFTTEEILEMVNYAIIKAVLREHGVAL